MASNLISECLLGCHRECKAQSLNIHVSYHKGMSSLDRAEKQLAVYVTQSGSVFLNDNRQKSLESENKMLISISQHWGSIISQHENFITFDSLDCSKNMICVVSYRWGSTKNSFPVGHFSLFQNVNHFCFLGGLIRFSL